MKKLPKELEVELKVPYLENAERVDAIIGGGYWPTLFKLKDGSIAAVCRAGAPHVGVNSRLEFIRSTDGGKSWKQSTAVPAIKGIDIRGSSSGVTADGTIVVAYWECDWFTSGKFDISKYEWETFYIYSTDNGKTWSKKIKMQIEKVKPVIYGRILAIDDKLSIMSIYGYLNGKAMADEHCCSMLLRSTDNGKTWGDLSVIAGGFNETTLMNMPDGRMLAIMRQEGRAIGVWQSESTDLGRTWSKPVQLTKAHQHPADLTLLKSGKLLLTYGNRIGDLVAGGMLSKDYGKTWDKKNRFIVERETLVLKGKTWGDCGYPSTVQLEDGTIVTICYKLGSSGLPEKEKEICLQHERDAFRNPPASEDMRRFEKGVVVRYTEEMIGKLLKRA